MTSNPPYDMCQWRDWLIVLKNTVDAIATSDGFIQDVVIMNRNPNVNDNFSDGYGIGTLWLNTSNNQFYLMYESSVESGSWMNISSGVISSGGNPPPVSTRPIGTLWHNSYTNDVFLKLSSGWVQVNQRGTIVVTNSNPTTASPPATDAQVGFLWFNPSQQRLFVYNGTSGSDYLWIPAGNRMHNGAGVPNTNNNASNGFYRGDTWFSTNSKQLYVCFSSSTSAATWHPVYNSLVQGYAVPTSGTTNYPLGIIFNSAETERLYILTGITPTGGGNYNYTWKEFSSGGSGSGQVIIGTQYPTTSTVGEIGDLYFASATDQLFVCTNKLVNIHTWEKVSPRVYSGNTNPSTSWNSSAGYHLGDLFWNIRTDELFILVNASAGNWKSTTRKTTVQPSPPPNLIPGTNKYIIGDTWFDTSTNSLFVLTGINDSGGSTSLIWTTTNKTNIVIKSSKPTTTNTGEISIGQYPVGMLWFFSPANKLYVLTSNNGTVANWVLVRTLITEHSNPTLLKSDISNVILDTPDASKSDIGDIVVTRTPLGIDLYLNTGKTGSNDEYVPLYSSLIKSTENPPTSFGRPPIFGTGYTDLQKHLNVGKLYLNTSNNDLWLLTNRVFNTSTGMYDLTWRKFDSGSGGSGVIVQSLPPDGSTIGSVGDLIYSTDYNVMYVCTNTSPMTWERTFVNFVDIDDQNIPMPPYSDYPSGVIVRKKIDGTRYTYYINNGSSWINFISSDNNYGSVSVDGGGTITSLGSWQFVGRYNHIDTLDEWLIIPFLQSAENYNTYVDMYNPVDILLVFKNVRVTSGEYPMLNFEMKYSRYDNTVGDKYLYLSSVMDSYSPNHHVVDYGEMPTIKTVSKPLSSYSYSNRIEVLIQNANIGVADLLYRTFKVSLFSFTKDDPHIVKEETIYETLTPVGGNYGEVIIKNMFHSPSQQRLSNFTLDIHIRGRQQIGTFFRE